MARVTPRSVRRSECMRGQLLRTVRPASAVLLAAAVAAALPAGAGAAGPEADAAQPKRVLRCPLPGRPKRACPSLRGIVPIGPRILIEARIKPKDIGYVQVGQTAVVKVNGYDFNVNGGLHGKIEYVSPDALGETEKNNEGTYYRALIAAERNTLRAKGEPLPVIPGMTAIVDIRTGERSVLSYLLRPMLKSKEALRER